jgi:diguanylate cyclase (GGDEF)-like protein
MAENRFLQDWVEQGEQNPEQIIDQLKAVTKEFQLDTTFFVSEKSRFYYHPSGILKSVQPTDPRDIWYFRFSSSRRPFEINIDRDTADRHRLVVFANARVESRDGRFLGAIGLGHKLASVHSLLSSYEKRYGTQIQVVDPDGQIAMSGQSQLEGQRITEVLAGAGNRLSPAVLGQPSASFSYREKGRTIFINTRRIPELDSVIVLHQSHADLEPEISQVLGGSLLIAIVISSVVLLIAQLTIRRFQQRLERLASTDFLTGLWNRTVFERLLQQVQSRAIRHGQPFHVALIDIDNFKHVNDQQGHLVGDRVLRHVADAIRGGFRPSDPVFRWGGEEFLVLLEECNDDQARQRLEQLRLRLQQTTLQGRDSPVRLTVSGGLTASRPDESIFALINRADEALYAAKHGGRDRIEQR